MTFEAELRHLTMVRVIAGEHIDDDSLNKSSTVPAIGLAQFHEFFTYERSQLQGKYILRSRLVRISCICMHSVWCVKEFPGTESKPFLHVFPHQRPSHPPHHQTHYQSMPPSLDALDTTPYP